MSLKKIEGVKADKGFKIFDLIIYGVIVALAVISFIVVFITRDTSPLTGIQVYFKNDVVFEYDFENDSYSILNASVVEIEEDGEAALKIKVYPEEGKFNEILIDKNGSVKMYDANCGKKDCVYTPEISDNSGWIYCLPHMIKIFPFSYADDGNITVG